MSRESGFYWVKFVDEWIVAEYRLPKYVQSLLPWWEMTGNEESYEDEDFIEIDERRIEREE